MKKQILLTLLSTLILSVSAINYGPGPVKKPTISYGPGPVLPTAETIQFNDGAIEINGEPGPVIIKEDLSAAEIRALANNLKNLLGLPQASMVRLDGQAQEISKDIINAYNELKKTNKTDAEHFLFRAVASLIEEADKKSARGTTTASSVLNTKPENLSFQLTMENKGNLTGLINSLINMLHKTAGQPRLEGTAYSIFNWIKTQFNNTRYRAIAQDFLILALVKVLNDNAQLVLATPATNTQFSPNIQPIGPEKHGGLIPVKPVKPNIRPIGPERRPTTPVGPEKGGLIPLNPQPILIK